MTNRIDRRTLLHAGLIGLSALAVPAQSRAQAPSPVDAAARRLIAAARAQIGVTTVYDPAYVRIAFPGGDVPMDRGVCTDVIVRAYRQAFGFDLQAAVNADMRAAFASYPRRWGLSAPDPHIDHRRVPNLQVFFTRKGAAQPTPARNDAWQAGDLITQMIAGRLPHIGIVSDQLASTGRPLIVHNIGRGTQIEDILAVYPVTGRYRFMPPA